MGYRMVFVLFLIPCIVSGVRTLRNSNNTQTEKDLESKGKVKDNPVNENSSSVHVTDTGPTVTVTLVSTTPCSINDTNNSTCGDNDGTFIGKMWSKIDKEMLKRAVFVLLGVTGIIVVYFVVKSVRLRRRRGRTRKYGVLATSDNLEMRPLDQDDDDEDLTVYEMNGKHRR